MARQLLKDRTNNVIGEIVDESNGNQRILDRYGKLKGWYNAHSNSTMTATGQYYGKGNLLTRLLN